jgi:hypothetical protein
MTGDEILCFVCDPETKRQSATWSSPKRRNDQEVRMQKSSVKVLVILTAFLLAKGIIYQELMTENSTNSKFYKELIKRLIAQIHSVRPEFQALSPSFGDTRDPHVIPSSLLL